MGHAAAATTRPVVDFNPGAADEAGGGLDKAKEDEAKRSKGQQQIAGSLSHLDKKKSGGIEAVTHVRVAADWRESQRRVAEEKQRQDRLQRLQEEAVRSGKQNAAVRRAARERSLFVFESPWRRRRRGFDVDTPWRRAAATPRRRRG